MARAARWGCYGSTISIWGRGRRGPFADSEERADHFHKHGADFEAKNAKDYEAKADVFLLGPKSATALDYTRSQGDLVRFDPATSHKRSTNLEYFNVSCLMRF